MNRLVLLRVRVIVPFVTVDRTKTKSACALRRTPHLSTNLCRARQPFPPSVPPSLLPSAGGCEFAITAHFVDCMSVRYLIARSANRRAAAPPPRPPTD